MRSSRPLLLRVALAACVAPAVAPAACAPPASTPGAPPAAVVAPREAVAAPGRPLVIAHRGASGHRPEHTLAAYDLAITMGADYVEPDLVSTRDSVLVARHENEIGGTTDVAERFPERRRTQTIDGVAVTGWFTEDFTLAELRTLRARERLPMRSRAHDGQHGIPTFDEVLALVARRSRELGRPIGVYPETKHPGHFRAIGRPLEEPLVAALRAHALDRADAPVFIQSFEVGNLERLAGMTRAPLVQLMAGEGAPPDRATGPGATTYAAMATPEGLRAVARYARAIGAEKRMVQPVDAAGALLPPTTLVRDAHAVGLAVHVWTLRNEPVFLPRAYAGDPAAEWRRLAELGVDGIFGDFPDVGVAARPRR